LVVLLPPTVSSKCIKRYVGTLKSFHADLGYPSEQLSSQVLEHVIRGILHFHRDIEHKEQLPITHPILKKIIAALSSPLLPKGISKELAETLKSAYSLSFAELFCCDEVTYNVFDPALNLKHRDVVIQSLTVDLLGSKTDPFRKGVHITIAHTNLSTCDYNHMIAPLAHPGLSDDPLFFGRHKQSTAAHS
jgi:hypothetical protein